MIPIIVVLHLGACTSTVVLRPADDLSGLSPVELLDAFLAVERSRGAVKFTFGGELMVRSGEIHRFRGYGATIGCKSLRLQLLGPMGFTLLDYLDADGEATIAVNRITPEGDKEAETGLFRVLRVFTLALAGRCYPNREVSLESRDEAVFDYSIRTGPGARVEFTLDRKTAALTRQAFSGGELPDTSVRYLHYERVDEYWMPGTIEVRTGTLPVTIDMTIKEWKLGVELPDGVFRVGR